MTSADGERVIVGGSGIKSVVEAETFSTIIFARGAKLNQNPKLRVNPPFVIKLILERDAEKNRRPKVIFFSNIRSFVFYTYPELERYLSNN